MCFLIFRLVIYFHWKTCKLFKIWDWCLQKFVKSYQLQILAVITMISPWLRFVLPALLQVNALLNWFLFKVYHLVLPTLFLLKSNGPYLRPSKSSHNPVVVMKFEFCAHSARLLRKLDHVLLWMLSTNTGLWQCRVKKISTTSNVLPLHFAPSQASSSQNSNVDNF